MTLKRSLLAYGFSCGSQTANVDGLYFVIGLIRGSVGPAGTVVANSIPGPLSQPNEDWILRVPIMNPPGQAAAVLLQQAVYVHAWREDSKAQRRMDKNDVIVLAVENFSPSETVYIQAETRCLFQASAGR